MVSPTRPNDMRHLNRWRVLSAVRRSGIASRTEISDLTKLSAATVSAITSDFLDEGVLVPPKQTGTTPTARGRPKVALMVNPEASLVCAAYFQLNYVSAAIVDYAGNTVAEHSAQIDTKSMSTDQICADISDCISKALDKANTTSDRLRRIAVGFQGVTDVEHRMVLWTPIIAERNLPIADYLEHEFGCPSQVTNDCDMIARALNWREPEKYGENFAAVLLARGVGMGLFLRKGVVNGIRSSAIEFGHMTYIPNGDLCRCGNRGCIEAYAGDYAISRRANGLDGKICTDESVDATDIRAVATSARAGDPKAIEAIEIAGSAIGTGIASMYALVDTFPLVLVGRGAELFDIMEPSIRAALESSPSDREFRRVAIDCYPNEKQLVQEGCAISALLLQDDEMAKRRLLRSTSARFENHASEERL